MRKIIALLTIGIYLIHVPLAKAYFTTDGQNIIDIKTGEIVQLRGIGLGGWLLPEGYMWGLRKLDRPRQFEAAIVDLIGPSAADKFWDLYYRNFVTREDVEVMKSWGVNTLRVPLLASMLQPREDQPAQPPYVYDENKFNYIDSFVDWCEELGMGIIWDLHGAPGGQNAANISDSDGTARLWTEKTIYWPRTIDLWDTITKRYSDKSCIVGYDLLNEPLLARYDGVDPAWLRELYLLITQVIRKTDSQGIIFIEGDDWAQDFSVLEPMNWDPHLVIAFHSYPPTHTQRGLQRWDDLRNKYNIPLWHGETGEQDPPWELYTRSTQFLADANVGWNWWTHKKFELDRQPWSIRRNSGFDKILSYWKGEGPRPNKWLAKYWLYKQARQTNSTACDFLPGMVKSLVPLDPKKYASTIAVKKPRLTRAPRDMNFMDGYSGVLRVRASGYPLEYQWYREGKPIDQATNYELILHELPMTQRTGDFQVMVWNEKGVVVSEPCSINWHAFKGMQMSRTVSPPIVDGVLEDTWAMADRLSLDHVISGSVDGESDLSAWYSALWDWNKLYFYIQVTDDSLSTNSSVDHLKDGIEIYIDADNGKSRLFEDNDIQIRFVIDEEELYADIGAALGDSDCQLIRDETGYAVEIAIPWESVNGLAVQDHYLGLDIHVNDNDGNSRDGKISWYAPRDNAYRSPMNFGTVKLIE